MQRSSSIFFIACSFYLNLITCSYPQEADIHSSIRLLEIDSFMDISDPLAKTKSRLETPKLTDTLVFLQLRQQSNSTGTAGAPEGFLGLTYTPELAIGLFFGMILVLVLLKSFLLYFPIENKIVLKFLKVISLSLMPYILLLILFSFIILMTMSSTINISLVEFINSISLFIIVWFVLGVIISIFSLMVIRKWESLEKKNNSFSATKTKYEAEVSSKAPEVNVTPAMQECYDIFEFLITKHLFINPVYSCFKPSSLRKDFSLSEYLTKKFIDQFKKLFSLTIAGWMVFIVLSMIWRVIVTESSLSKFLFITIYPAILCVALLIMRLYLIEINRNFSKQVTDSDCSNFNQTLDYNSHLGIEFVPKYLKKYMTNEASKADPEANAVNNHFVVRAPSLFESIAAFGIFGKYFIELILQAVLMSGIGCITLLISSEIRHLAIVYGVWVYPFLIIYLIVFIFLFSYLLTLNLRWLTLYSSLEMNRDDLTIKEVNSAQLTKAASHYNKLFNSFKMIYFDKLDVENRANKSEYSGYRLNNKYMKNLIDYQFNVFLIHKLKMEGLSEDEIKSLDLGSLNIQIDNELTIFLNTCGNFLEESEIEFMLHFTEKRRDAKGSNPTHITINDIYDILGAMLFFKAKDPAQIVQEVIVNYLISVNVNHYNIIPQSILRSLFEDFQEYFDKESVAVLIDELPYFKEISLDSIVQHIVINRRYYPN